MSILCHVLMGYLDGPIVKALPSRISGGVERNSRGPELIAMTHRVASHILTTTGQAARYYS
jgi:hypothetical protein